VLPHLWKEISLFKSDGALRTTTHPRTGDASSLGSP
jgi:hypothetical protein